MHETLLTATAAVYFLSTLGYFGYLARADDGLARLARYACMSGLLVHTLAIGVRCSKGLPPVISPSDMLSFAAWTLVGGFLGVQLRWKIPSVGAFVSPLVCLLVLLAVLLPKPVLDLADLYATVWFPIHVVLAVAGDVAFALAAAFGLMYLIQEKNVKAKKVGGVSRRLPNLEVLDRVNHRLVTIGFPLLTLGILTGVFWVRARPELDTAALRPKILWTVITWLLYAVVLNGRMLIGLRGRKAALLSMTGFALVLATFASLRVFGS